jgi:hypothetical protein
MSSRGPRKARSGALQPHEHQECISGQKRTIGIREKWCARPYNISQLSISSPGVAVLILGHRIAHSPPLKHKKVRWIRISTLITNPHHYSSLEDFFRGLQAVMITNETFGIRQIHVFR